MHHSWLLNGQHTQTKAVREAIIQKLQQRGTVGLKITPEKLMERGLLMEERDYVSVSRGVSTVFVYVAPAGQDLYVSRATTVLPAIDSFRAVLLGLVVFITLFGPPNCQWYLILINFNLPLCILQSPGSCSFRPDLRFDLPPVDIPALAADPLVYLLGCRERLLALPSPQDHQRLPD